jgi:hypothetical protein
MKFAISNFDIVLIAPEGVRTVGLDHPAYVDICKNLQAGKFDEVTRLLDVKAAIAAPYEKATLGQVEVRENADPMHAPEIFVDGLQVYGRVAEMITQCEKKGIPTKALKAFWKKVQANPLLVGKESMLSFLQNNNVPLLPNGNFLAYKGVFETSDPAKFTAVHDTSFVYTLGEPATLEREECTVDINNTCGPGLHVGGFNHATGYGNTIIDCEVDPADVTSVPQSEAAKLRACKVLPVRVNKDRICYAEEYLDLNKLTLEKGAPEPKSVRADTKKSGGRTKKTTWYKLSGKQVLVQRKVKSPGSEWTAVKPNVDTVVKTKGVSKAVSKPAKRLVLKGAAPMRTWYKILRNGTVDRIRAQEKPTGYSSHKPN